jgi:Ca2+/Na+ antiporter
MNVSRPHRIAGILIKLAVIISLLFLFLGGQPRMAGISIFIPLAINFLQYGLGHLVQSGKYWARFPFLILTILFFIAFTVDLPFNYHNIWWLVAGIPIQGLSIYAVFLIFFSKASKETELADEAILDRDFDKD